MVMNNDWGCVRYPKNFSVCQQKRKQEIGWRLAVQILPRYRHQKQVQVTKRGYMLRNAWARF